jgi:hypothetical protein
MANKIRDFKNYKNYIEDYDMANMFYVYPNNDLDQNVLIYNINRTIQFEGLNKTEGGTFESYQVIDGDTWNMISFKHYDTTMLWWLVCKLNGVINPTIEPEVGDVLRIMNKQSVGEVLNKLKEL